MRGRSGRPVDCGLISAVRPGVEAAARLDPSYFMTLSEPLDSVGQRIIPQLANAVTGAWGIVVQTPMEWVSWPLFLGGGI